MASRGRPMAGQSSPVGARISKAKLRPPSTPAHHVRRARLHRLLDQVTDAPVTLVVAPAGAGKTSLLAAWTAESSTPTCWLTLDESDRDPAQFWSGVIEALETVAPGCGERARALLRQPEALSAAIDELLDDLDSRLAIPTTLGPR